MATLHPPLIHRSPLTHRLSALLSDITEGQLRGTAAVTVLLSQIVGAIGLAWDIQWHISVGRDTFLTPPHILLYSSVTITGLVSLLMVLVDTWRARTGPLVHDGNSVTIFGVFRAPLGFAVAGFGALVTATAAPLDNYWHELYGLDVALWAPFHTMGALGGFIGLLGMLYTWGSLLVHERRAAGGQVDRMTLPAWGLLGSLVLLVGTATVQSRPALVNTPLLHLGSLDIALFPLLLSLFVPWLFVLARVVLGRRLAPLQLVAVWSAFTAGLLILVPWLVRIGAAAEGLPMRGGNVGTGLAMISGLLMLGLLAVAGLTAFVLERWSVDQLPDMRAIIQVGAITGLGLWLVGLGLAAFTASQIALAASAGLPVTRIAVGPSAMLLALPLSMVAATTSTALGAGLAQILRRNPR